MKSLSKVALLAGVLLVSACASQQPVLVQPGARSSSVYGQSDPLQSTARQANSVESIASSLFRVGRLIGGGY